jgi:hypothetical protein
MRAIASPIVAVPERIEKSAAAQGPQSSRLGRTSSRIRIARTWPGVGYTDTGKAARWKPYPVEWEIGLTVRTSWQTVTIAIK